MANSRSNIYPVQLQGAELNLNKYDAEIKQYSGFNKNNSPFVGGCLSNLFTKTEENTTGSSDSVYVDDNGDVYEAKTDGLYKNGEMVYFSGGSVQVKQLDLPSNTIFVKNVKWYTTEKDYDDEFFYVRAIDISYNNAYLKVCFRDVEQYINVLLTDENNDVVNIQDVRIDTKITPVMPNFEGNIEFIIRLDGVKDNKVYMCGKAFELRYFAGDKGVYAYNTVFKKNVSVSDFINIPPVVREGTIFSFYGVDESYSSSNEKYSIVEDGGSNKTTCIGKSKYFFKGDSTVVLLDISNYTISGSQSIMIYAQYRESHSPDPTITILKDDVYSYPSVSYSSGTTLSVKLGKVDNNYDVRGCYALKFSDNKLFYGIAGSTVTDKVTLVDDGSGAMQVMMYMGVKAGTRLYNNGIVTGIALGDTLITEWNSVDGKTVRENYNASEAIFQNINTKKWYYAYISYDDILKPYVVKKVNNLIVWNTTGKNCYRPTDGKVLYFAPAWNNRVYDDGTTITKSGTAITDNAGYMATSINEYNLKDNASILLNPVPVIKLPSAVTNYPLDVSVLKGEVINIYAGSDGEILYRLSWDWFGNAYNPDLKGLPFPINTSGNVQLSPSLFCETERFGNDVFIKEGSNAYQLIKEGSESVMSYYLGTLIENLEEIFILQGQYYAIINKQIFNVQFSGGVVQTLSFVVSVENLQFCGNSAYQAYFFSKTNRCIYVFTGANILNQMQLVDKISEIYAYKYNQSTQSIILITDLGTIISSNLGMYLLEGFTPDNVFFYDKGVVFVSDSELTYLQYYEADGFEKHNIELETCFYGMNNETVTINDCLYLRLFSEEHEEGEVKVSATTISLRGRKTEETVFKFKASDWDKLTHSVYVRYQPKEQRGLGISFSINSPFKIASMSIGSKADAILIDKVSKGAINAPEITSNNIEW